MSATAVTIPPTGSYPPTPPNTIETRSRATSNVSNLSRALSEPLQSPSILVNGDAPRHQGPPRNVAFVNFPRVLSQIQEENPGYFYEAPTGVPDNTPAVTEAPSTPRSQTGPTTFDLPRIDERLDELPELVESKLGSPVPSVFGGSTDNQSTTSEPLTMAIRPRPASSPLCKLKTNDNDNKTSSGAVTPSKITTAAEIHAGIREYSDWAYDIECDIQRDLARLANLANDDYQRDPSVTAEEYYRSRLYRLVNDQPLQFVFSELGQPPMPTPTEQQTPGKAAPLRFSAQYVTSYEFNQLKARVTDNEQRVNGLTDMHNGAVKNVKTLKQKFETKLDEAETKIKGVQGEQAVMKQDIALLKKMLLKDTDEDVNNLKLSANGSEDSSKKA